MWPWPSSAGIVVVSSGVVMTVAPSAPHAARIRERRTVAIENRLNIVLHSFRVMRDHHAPRLLGAHRCDDRILDRGRSPFSPGAFGGSIRAESHGSRSMIPFRMAYLVSATREWRSSLVMMWSR